MKAGIIGGRGVGKSTVFHALTGLAPLAGASDTKNRARLGQIKVPDPRLDFLERAYSSKKRVPVELTVVDFGPGLKEQKPGAALDATLIPLMRELDAILMVIPSFAAMPAEFLATLEGLEAELVFADFEQAERRLERLKKERSASDLERVALERCLKQLEAGLPLRRMDLNAQELQVVAHFCFLSHKPALVVINCEPEQAGVEPTSEQARALAERDLEVMRMAAAFEAELWELSEDERQEMSREAGFKEAARERLIAALYRHLGLITFYTVGEPEAHAWSLRAGASALEAAGRIHSDIARGFIRAEVFNYEDFVQHGSEASIKSAGKLRLEGKDYVMRDADIIHIRFKI